MRILPIIIHNLKIDLKDRFKKLCRHSKSIFHVRTITKDGVLFKHNLQQISGFLSLWIYFDQRMKYG